MDVHRESLVPSTKWTSKSGPKDLAILPLLLLLIEISTCSPFDETFWDSSWSTSIARKKNQKLKLLKLKVKLKKKKIKKKIKKLIWFLFNLF